MHNDADEVEMESGVQEGSRCPYTVNGVHEPNLILKDNDIKYKIRLSLENTINLLRQIRLDAEFMYSLGIMDYSLLVGVHNTEYEVKEDGDAITPRLTKVVSKLDGPRGTLLRRESAAQILQHVHSSSPLVLKEKDRSVPASSTHPSVDSEEKTSSNSGSAVTFENKKQEIEFSKVKPVDINRNPAVSESSETIEVSTANEPELALAQKLEVYKVVGPDAYFIGIIDFQQKWDFSKKVSRCLLLSSQCLIFLCSWRDSSRSISEELTHKACPPSSRSNIKKGTSCLVALYSSLMLVCPQIPEED
jgi:1-phosphatidylinositol-4-phosphate 5-kinase